MTGDTADNPMWRLYAGYGRERLPDAAWGIAGTLVTRLSELVPAFILGLAIDAVFLDERAFRLPLLPDRLTPTEPAAQLWLSAGVIAAAFLVGAGASWVGDRGWNAFAQSVQHALRVEAYDAMQRLSMAFFDDRQTGELLSVLNNDVNQLEEFLNDGVSAALRIVVMVVGIGAILWSLNPSLALVAMLPVPVIAIFAHLFVRTIQPKYAAMRASVGALNSRLENNLGGIAAIKAERAEPYESRRVAHSSLEYYHANWDTITTRITFYPALTVITGLGFVVTFAVGGLWVLTGPPPGLSGTLTAGAFVTFVVYVQGFIWPIAQVGQIVNMYQRARASSARVFDLMGETDRLPERDDASDLEIGAGVVEYENVTFGYDPDRPVLRAVSLSVRQGETLGVVGPTGGGKSTLVKLLVRLYDVDAGTIRIDDQDVRDVRLSSLRRQIGYVGQEPFLFPGTVRENVAYGTPEATDAEVAAAIEAAGADEFVDRLPAGYDTLVGERGVKLSGGQRQRLAIARAVLAGASILILDEATSHVDTETEALIGRGLAVGAHERTTIAIAHRLSTVRHADRIVVIEGGRIVESGSHEALLAADGLYANLWRIQAGNLGDVTPGFVEAVIRRRAAVDTAETDAPGSYG